MCQEGLGVFCTRGLNESPSEKEGKLDFQGGINHRARLASMKVPPKRKGNALVDSSTDRAGAPQ